MVRRRLSRYILTGSAILVSLNLGSGCPPTGEAPEAAGPPGPTPSVEGVVDLAATGQTASYAGADDGALQLGEWVSASLRFVDNGDGTITDQSTGLMWLEDASCMINNYPEWETDGWADGWVPWLDALAFIGRINDGTLSACGAGHTDWRLPNVNELESLVNCSEGQVNQWLMAAGFTGVEGNDYWTSTTDPDSPPIFAYVVSLADGVVSRLGNKSSVITSVWPVRGTTTGSTCEIWQTGQTTSYATADDGDLLQGIAWPSPRFTDNGDGTVTDNLTGLMWLQDFELLTVPSWTEALAAAGQFNGDPSLFESESYTASYTDWRVPNRKELYSLANFGETHPALAADHPFINVSVNASYWSSTTYAGNTDYAWHVDLRTGEIGADYKVNAHRLVLVR